MKIPDDLKIARLDAAKLIVDGVQVGWEASTYPSGEGDPLGSGFGDSRDDAERIAVAETIERYLIRFISLSNETELTESFGTKKNQTSSGFAVGPTESFAALNALCEGYEHFVRYQGIHLGRRLDSVSLTLSPENQVLADAFDSVSFWERRDSIDFQATTMELRCCIALAQKDQGIFLGAVCRTPEAFDPKHALIEALRNLRTCTPSKVAAPTATAPSVFRQRNRFFATRADLVWSHLNSNPSAWPKANLESFSCRFLALADCFLARAIFENSPDWSNLSTERLI